MALRLLILQKKIEISLVRVAQEVDLIQTFPLIVQKY